MDGTLAVVILIPCIVNNFLSDSPPRHLILDVGESRLVLTEVIGHVAVGVDA